MKLKLKIVCMIICLALICIGCSEGQNPDGHTQDLAKWNEEKVYAFLNEVQQHIRSIPVETNSIDRIVEQYELYFTPELSETIVDSLYIKTENGWRIPDGDAGYIFSVPDKKSEVSAVVIEYSHDFIKIIETYEIGMFKLIAYTIRDLNKPVITGWIREFD